VTRVKICGITDKIQALAAAEAGADYIGLVFAPSRRQVIPQKAAEIVHEVCRLEHHPMVVGVFVNSPATDVNFVAEACHLDWVQLSGDESWDFCKGIKKPVIKAIHVFKSSTIREIIGKIEGGYSLFSREKLICLLDSKVRNVYGGTGKTFDWQLAKEISASYPVMIAGGLTPENVGQLVKGIRPWGVDVSSGVETEGKKDIQKIKDFVKRAKR
jgi:phosphoribosylanthranilate isomerase